jgi:peptidyl-tRNA hydrolase, PTH2 family
MNQSINLDLELASYIKVSTLKDWNTQLGEIKQVLVMRKDLKMSPGKLAAQAAHASVLALWQTSDTVVSAWRKQGITKVTLAVDSEKKLLDLYKKAVAAYLPVGLVADEGRTEVKPGSITGLGIGPANVEEINKITGDLKLY